MRRIRAEYRMRTRVQRISVAMMEIWVEMQNVWGIRVAMQGMYSIMVEISWSSNENDKLKIGENSK